MGNISINHFLLLITSIIWGGAFVFQKTAMDNIDPYLYSSLRFFAGAFSLIPITLFVQRRDFFFRVTVKKKSIPKLRIKWAYLKNLFFKKNTLGSGFIAGIILTLGVNLQQVALYYTQVAKVSFITSFYILFVPFIGIFLGRSLSKNIFIAAIVAIMGFYFLSHKDTGYSGLGGFLASFQRGDVITLVSSFFWALHIVYIDTCSKKLDNFVFSFLQFFFCGSLTLIFVVISGIEISWGPINAASIEILYGGIVSVGIGYTLQVFGQQKVAPHMAALIVSLEAIFATFFEMIVLKAFLSWIEVFGCFLLFSSVIYSQFSDKKVDI